MSLFHSPRERRFINSRKRKKGPGLTDQEDFVNNERFPCDLCSDGYDSETELHLHRRSKHRTVIKTMLMDELVCKTCTKKQENSDELLKHIKSQHLFSCKEADYVEREIFICDTCNLIYFNKQMLSIHMQYSHDTKNKHKLSTDCPKCDKVVQIRHIWFHFQRHLIQSVVCCPICLMKCKSQKELYEHINNHAHFYHCNICGYDTKTRELFVTHMDTHVNRETSSVDDELLVRCFVPKQLTKKSDFNFGLRGLYLYDLKVCILCRAICTEESMVEHILQYHMVVKNMETKRQYMCECGEIFFNNVLLKHHVFKLKGDHKPCQ